MYALTVYGIKKDGGKQTIMAVKSGFVEMLRDMAKSPDKLPRPQDVKFDSIEVEHNLPSKEELKKARDAKPKGEKKDKPPKPESSSNAHGGGPPQEPTS